MPVVQTGGFSVDFNMSPAVANPGLDEEHWASSLFMHPSLGMLPQTTVRATSHIRVKFKGKIQATTSDVDGSFEVGFVQSLTQCTRTVDYGGQHVFDNTHPNYPIKDGSGSPWYKTHADALYKIPQAKALGRLTTHHMDFTVECDDRPSFGFPDTIGGIGYTQIDVHDQFATCLMVRLKGAQSFYLYQINWEFQFTATPSPAGLVFVGNGYNVQNHQAVVNPSVKPAQICITGTPANSAVQILVDGA